MLFDRVAGRWPVACSPSGSIGSMCCRGIRIAGGHLRDGAGTAMRTLLSGLDFPLTLHGRCSLPRMVFHENG